MKRTEILPAIEEAFDKRECDLAGRVVFTWESNHIICIDAKKSGNCEIIFGNYRLGTVLLGLTEKEWGDLESRVIRWLAQKGLN